MDHKRLNVLDGFRALAALMVVAFHYTVRWTAPLDPSEYFPQAHIFTHIAPLHYGWTGVELFFVISGFVILMTLDRSTSPLDFAVRRFARLWPMLIVATILTTLVVNTIGPSDWHVTWPNFLMSLLTLHPPGFNLVIGAVWSLGIEIRLYVLAAIIHAVARRDFLKVAIFVQVAALVALAIPKLAPLSFLLGEGYLAYFLFGMCCYAIWAGRGEARTAVVGLALSAAAILITPFIDFPGMAGSPLGFDAVNIAIMALFWLFVIGSPVIKPFGSIALRRVGEASYSLYLMHENAGVPVIVVLTKAGIPIWVAIPAVIAAMIGMSLLTFRLVEIPAKRWILAHVRFASGDVVSGPATPETLAAPAGV